MKLAVVVPRYGPAIAGGAETLARSVAQSLARWHRVTVLTTTATDYVTWRSALPSGEDADGRVQVLRFVPERERTPYWHELNRLLESSLARGDTVGVRTWPPALQEEYVRWQGPYPPELFEWLRRHSAALERVLFFTYLYPTSYFGAACVAAEKIDFYPTLHDEPTAYLPIMARSFRRAARLLFCSDTERALADTLYAVGASTSAVIGYGLDTPPREPARGTDSAAPYLLYVGRIDLNKGVDTLIRDFIRWRTETPDASLRLLLAGTAAMELPVHPDIEYRGHVSDSEKFALMRGALAVVHPSAFESLGLVVLEAFSCGTPALVVARNPVLVAHCRQSNGGLWYVDYSAFAAALSWLLQHPREARVLGAQGCAYTQARYGRAAYEQRLAALYPAEAA